LGTKSEAARTGFTKVKRENQEKIAHRAEIGMQRKKAEVKGEK